MTPLVFDSHALLSFLQMETGSEKVKSMLKAANASSVACHLNVINFGEILYITQRRFGQEARMRVFIAIQQMGIRILSCPNSLVYDAAELKATHAISYADAFALATAIEQKATLVTGDAEFRRVQHLVRIEWV